MINGYDILKKKYDEFDEDQRQPNGIDLRLGKVYRFGGEGYLYGLLNDSKNVPPHIEEDVTDIETHNGIVKGWILQPCTPYILEVDSKIKISDDCAQMYYPRSTLLRCACTLHTAVGDAGYNGKLAFLFINHSKNPFVMEEGVRFAQLVDHQVDSVGKSYNGDYQNDKHKGE